MKQKNLKFSVALTIMLAAATSIFAQTFSGSGTESDPYMITSAEELALLSDLMYDTGYAAAYYELANDIDLSEYGEEYNYGRGWLPIGHPSQPFKGVFNGNGKVITGLYTNTTQDYIGLFGYVEGGTIENIGLENVNITGNWLVGGIAGSCSGNGVSATGTISRCYVTGTVTGNWYNYPEVGGIAGQVVFGSVAHCYSTATVTGAGTNVGGIAGQVNASSSVTLCYSTGVISGTDWVGGIASDVSNSSILSDCIALNPKITTTGTHFGRITSWVSDASLSGNLAFNGMLNPSGDTEWYNIAPDNLDGANISGSAILADGTLGGKFTSADGWTTEDGKLPGLFGKTLDMPEHLTNGSGIKQLEITNYEWRIENGQLIISLPNPSKGGAYEAKVDIFDVMGKKAGTFLISPSFGWSRGEVNISHLPNGIYFLKVNNKTVKVIKN